jgi:hypothetical protein
MPISPATLGKTFTQICSMDIVFTVTNSNSPNGLDRILFRETVANTTGQTWLDFHIQLGFGTGTQFTPANCGVGFVTVPVPTSTQFAVQGVGSNAIDFGGGNPVATGGTVGFTFNVNVQNLSNCIPPGFATTKWIYIHLA